MTPDEARLREVVGRLTKRIAEIDAHVARYPNSLDTAPRDHASDLRFMIDALSAERERRDRAVENATIALRVLNSIPECAVNDGVMVAWSVSDDVPEDIYVAKSYLDLATQKAEGAK